MKTLTPLLGCLILLSACTAEPISPEEKEFNESGRAKAILRESDMWKEFAQLQGTWVSLDDEKYKVTIEEYEKIDFYDGEEMSREKFTLSKGDESGTKMERDILLTAQAPEGEVDYSITEITDTSLMLLHLPRGNILRFTKQ
jgi:hypothetical protein